ncbi:MAG TPA: hypothetical protein VKA69_02200, partial [Desulfobacteria bacterium]|nr:hypothetical protein [Desulfobacteria bacterium]
MIQKIKNPVETGSESVQVIRQVFFPAVLQELFNHGIRWRNEFYQKVVPEASEPLCNQRQRDAAGKNQMMEKGKGQHQIRRASVFQAKSLLTTPAERRRRV